MRQSEEGLDIKALKESIMKLKMMSEMRKRNFSSFPLCLSLSVSFLF